MKKSILTTVLFIMWSAQAIGADTTIEMLNKKGKEMGKMTKQELQQYFDEADVSISSNGIIYRTDKQGFKKEQLEAFKDILKNIIYESYPEPNNRENNDYHKHLGLAINSKCEKVISG